QDRRRHRGRPLARGPGATRPEADVRRGHLCRGRLGAAGPRSPCPPMPGTARMRQKRTGETELSDLDTALLDKFVAWMIAGGVTRLTYAKGTTSITLRLPGEAAGPDLAPAAPRV